MVYVLWSKQEIDDKYILSIKNTLEELKAAYATFYKKKKKEYDIEENIQESELESFTPYSDDYNTYYCEISNIDINKEIYIFKCRESGEGGGYHEYIDISISNTKEELYENAITIFCNESEKTSKKHIKKMLETLKTKGIYVIEYPIRYLNVMEIYIFEELF